MKRYGRTSSNARLPVSYRIRYSNLLRRSFSTCSARGYNAAMTIAPPLLTAKFHRPTAPRHLVARPALVARLHDGLAAGRPLTLIAAPAGYGKTTLAAAWAAQLTCPVAWLALDEADDDPLRFCTYLLAALQRVAPTVGAELLPALRSGQLPPQAVLVSTLVNDLAAVQPAPLVCVLDDFHAVQDSAILSLVQALLAHADGGLHLCLATREDPALPLARLRARDQLTEVRAADLRLSEAETGAFLRDGMGLPLAPADVARLAERTEGWAVGLQLAGLSLQGRSDPAAFVESLSGSHRFILSYLTEEVLARQPAAVQAFLLQTSLLERLCGELCDAVTGGSGSADLLERLVAANLFIVPLDDEARWYRYHHLFGELLQTQLRRRGPEQVAELHRRASRWHEAQAMPVEAIGHALAAGEHERVVALLERHGWALLNQGEAHRLERWLAALPADWGARSPRINLDFGWMRLLRGQPAQVGPHLAAAEAALAHAGDSAAGPLRAECLALQANLLQAQGRTAEAIAAAEGALRLTDGADLRLSALAHLALGGAYRQTPDYDRAERSLQAAIHASRQSGDLVTEALAVAHLTLMALPYGRLHRAAAAAIETIERLAQAGAAPPPIVGAVHGALGLIYWEWNQAASAHEHLARGIRLGALSGHGASVIYSQCNLARLLQAEGALEASAALLEEAARLLAVGAPGWVRPELIARQAGQALAQGDPAAAEAHLRASGVTPDAPVTHLTDGLHLAWLRLLIARGDPLAAPLAERIIAAAEAGGRDGILLEALVLAARLAADDPRASPAYLARALTLAEPEGALRVFLDEGEAIRTQIAEYGLQVEKRLPGLAATNAVRLRAFAASVLAAFGGPTVSDAHPPTPLAPQSEIRNRQSEILIEPLSERELEALRLLAAGLTYAEIADRLVVSLNTVRFHVKEIYGKLGVNRQAQAVARARELGLL